MQSPIETLQQQIKILNLVIADIEKRRGEGEQNEYFALAIAQANESIKEHDKCIFILRVAGQK